MSRRAPSAIPVSLAILHHHRWVISARGLANIVPSPDHVVYGVVYSLPTSQIAALDDAEGVSRGLYQHLHTDVEMILKDLDSTECKQVPIPCWTYIDRQSSQSPPEIPSAEYVECINNGIQDAKPPNEWVARNIRVFIPLSPSQLLQAALQVPGAYTTGSVHFRSSSAPSSSAPNSSTGIVVATGPSPQTLYFAYGSNLWLKQMALRCPNSVKVGTGILYSHKWGITSRGYANVYPSSNHVVYGTVFTLLEADEVELDRYEGVSGGSYIKKDLDVELLSTEGESKMIQCLVYIDPSPKGHFRPRKEYIHRINSGLKDADLPAKWVQQNIRPFVPDQ